MAHGPQLAAWQVRAIHLLRDQGDADLALVITGSAQSGVDGGLLWRLFAHAVRPESLKRREAFYERERLPTLLVSDVVNISGHKLDFIVSFAAQVHDALADVARFGVWSFELGRCDRDAEPPCFREIYEGEPTFSFALVRTLPRGRKVTLREGHLRAIDYHYGRCVDKMCFEAAKWPAYVSRELARGITNRFLTTPIDRPKRAYHAPSNGATLRFLCILARNVVRQLLRRNRAEEWNIGAVRMQPSELLDGARMENVRWLPAIAGGWVADPMALRADGKIHVLCEEMQLRSGKGRISVASFNGYSWSQLKVVIETATHASYPYLFEHGGEIYCVPETFEAEEIALYRARSFPTAWERVATLVSGLAAVDATLFVHEGWFWILCTTSESSDAALLAFFAADILGPWSAHPGNPLKVDVRGSRPAGAPFRVAGTLYRPAQDCSKTYGGRVVIHRVAALTPTQFREEPCAYAEPIKDSPYDQGLHTLSFAGEYCIIDGKRWSP